MHASVEPGKTNIKVLLATPATARDCSESFYFFVGLQPEYFTKTINYFIQ